MGVKLYSFTHYESIIYDEIRVVTPLFHDRDVQCVYFVVAEPEICIIRLSLLWYFSARLCSAVMLYGVVYNCIAHYETML